MNAQKSRNLIPWHTLAAAALILGGLAGEVAAQAPALSSNSAPAQASTEGPGPARPKPEQGRVEGTVTFSWAVGGDPTPMDRRLDRGGDLRGTRDLTPWPRPSFSTVTIVAYPLKAGPGAQEPSPRSPRNPVATAVPDFNGRFSMALDPGEYEIVGIPGTRPGRTDRVPTRSFKVRVEPGKSVSCLFSF